MPYMCVASGRGLPGHCRWDRKSKKDYISVSSQDRDNVLFDFVSK